jgi:hypothetical protein
MSLPLLELILKLFSLISFLENHLFFVLLLFIVILEIIENFGDRLVLFEEVIELLSNIRKYLLGVITLVDWSIFIQLVLKSEQVSIGNIFDLQPLEAKRTSPFTFLVPEVLLLSSVNITGHLCNSTEMLRLIYTEEQIDVTTLTQLFGFLVNGM